MTIFFLVVGRVLGLQSSGDLGRSLMYSRGLVIWIGLFSVGVHPMLAGVVLGWGLRVDHMVAKPSNAGDLVKEVRALLNRPH